MDRRTFVKLVPVSMAAVSIPMLGRGISPAVDHVVEHEKAAVKADMGKGRYIIFANPEAIDLKAFLDYAMLSGEQFEVVYVRPGLGKNIADEIAIYKVENEHAT